MEGQTGGVSQAHILTGGSNEHATTPLHPDTANVGGKDDLWTSIPVRIVLVESNVLVQLLSIFKIAPKSIEVEVLQLSTDIFEVTSSKWHPIGSVQVTMLSREGKSHHIRIG